MGLVFEILYHLLVVKEDIPKLSSVWRGKIRKAIEDKLTTEPELYGKPLRKSLNGYRKLRVGDYRVIFRIEKKCVKIFMIGNRGTIYKRAGKRGE